jgi:hypothetical protein
MEWIVTQKRTDKHGSIYRCAHCNQEFGAKDDFVEVEEIYQQARPIRLHRECAGMVLYQALKGDK